MSQNTKDFSFSFDTINSIIERTNNKLIFDHKQQKKFLITFERLLRRTTETNAISHMAEISTGPFQRVCLEIKASLKEGGTISDGMSNWFDPIVVQGVRIGEESNGLHDAVKASIASHDLGVSYFLRAFSSLVYPLITLIASGLAFVFLGNKLLPLIQGKLAKMASIPMDAQVVLAVNEFFTLWLFPSLVFIVVLFFLVANILSNNTSEVRLSLDSRPIFYEYRQMKALFFLRMFSLLKKYNLEDVVALQTILQTQKNGYLRWHLREMLNAMKEGQSLSIAIDTGLINKNDVMTLKFLADDSGKDDFCDVIDTTVEGIVNEMKSHFELIASTIKNVMLVVIGFLLYFLMTFVMTIDKYYVS